MSEANFTKGEWEVIDGTQVGEQVLFVHAPNNEIGKGSVVCRLTRVVDTHIPLSYEDIANAHLIATAPKMYKFLDDLANGRGTDYPVEQLLAEARGER